MAPRRLPSTPEHGAVLEAAVAIVQPNEMISTSNTSVALPGMMGGTPRDPYANSGGTVMRAFCPLLNLGMASSHPRITWPTPCGHQTAAHVTQPPSDRQAFFLLALTNRNSNGLSRSLLLSNLSPPRSCARTDKPTTADINRRVRDNGRATDKPQVTVPTRTQPS